MTPDDYIEHLASLTDEQAWLAFDELLALALAIEANEQRSVQDEAQAR